MKYKIIEALNQSYEKTGTSCISDEEYDDLVDHDDYLEKAPSKHFKVIHKEPVKKMARVYVDQDSNEMLTRKEFYNSQVVSDVLSYFCLYTIKIDGVFGSAYYNQEGELEYCITKGDYTTGYDISDKAIMLGLPAKITYLNDPKYSFLKEHGMIVNFEICISKKNFESLKADTNQLSMLIGFIKNRTGLQNVQDLYKNLMKVVELIVHNVFVPNQESLVGIDDSVTIESLFEYVTKLGFKTVLSLPYTKRYAKDIKQFSETIKLLYKKNSSTSNKYSYFADGIIVISNEPIDDLNYKFSSFSIKNKPKKVLSKTAIAVKFKCPDHTRVLLDIEKNISKSGKVSYVGIYSPIYESSKTFTRVSLGTDKFIQNFKIEVGTTVTISITSGLIPAIQGVFNDQVYTPVKKRNVR